MTGLDLESFLLLLRAHLGAWTLLGLGTLVLFLLAWVSWGSRELCENAWRCHSSPMRGWPFYGSTVPSVLRVLRLAQRSGPGTTHPANPRLSRLARRPPPPAPADPTIGLARGSESTAGRGPRLTSRPSQSPAGR